MRTLLSRHFERRCRIGARIVIAVDPVADAVLHSVCYTIVQPPQGFDMGLAIAGGLTLSHLSYS